MQAIFCAQKRRENLAIGYFSLQLQMNLEPLSGTTKKNNHEFARMKRITRIELFSFTDRPGYPSWA